MSKKNKKYYAVKVGKKPGVYTTWSECSKQVSKFKGAIYKSFNNLEDAEKFSKTSGIAKHKSNKTPQRSTKICLICEKPHRTKNQCCTTCCKYMKDLKPILEPYSKLKRISASKVINIKNKFKCNNVFEFIGQNPTVWRSLDPHKKRLEIKRNIREHHRSAEYRNHTYSKWEGDIPMYILELFNNHPTKKLLTISGNRMNPYIHYLCLICNEEQTQLYQDLKNNKGHNCSSSKSSGELIVEQYLKDNFTIKTQHETLKCINPITGRQLPYDIEVADKKVLVEIQGEQHLKFIEYFHGTIENFHYQQRKDEYKKSSLKRKDIL